MRRCSGFWLRRDCDGRLDQIDLAFPWQPVAGTLPGIRQIAEALGLPEAMRGWLDELPVRHVAIPAAGCEDADNPVVTLYVSAALDRIPTGEAELQAAVSEAARIGSVRAQRLLGLLPALPDVETERSRLTDFIRET